MKIIQFYKDILSVAGLDVDKDGLTSAGDLPFLVKGKRLALPTETNLRANKDNVVIFHPLSENVLRGESDVMGKFRSALNIRLNYLFGCLAQELMALGTSVALHKELNPDQQQLLTALKDANEKTLTVLQSILKKMTFDNTSRNFINIYNKKGGVVNGKKYNRACIVSFPFYEELNSDSKTVFDITISKKDRNTIISLVEFMFTSIGQPEYYSHGSYDSIAPTLDALMGSVKKLINDVNMIVSDYGKFFTDVKDYEINSDWVESFEDLSIYNADIRMIPMQAGNEGDTLLKQNNTQQLQQQQLTTPQYQAPNPTPQPMWQAPINNGQYNNPAPKPTSDGIVRTANGIDFASSTRHNPAFQQVGTPTNMMMPNATPMPRWAVPQYQNPNNFGGMQVSPNPYGGYGGGYMPSI